jgi:CRP-like cAMP-binding protein
MAHATFDVGTELRLIPGFAEVGGPVVEEVAARCSHRVAHANVTLVEQGKAAAELHFLARGAAKTVHQPSNVKEPDPVVLTVMRAPCVVPDVSIFDGKGATASVITLRSSHVIALPREALFEIFERSPTFARFLLTRATADVRAHVRRIEELVSGSADERIINLLERLARAHGTQLGQGRFIAIPLRRRDIACMVNATTETVSRLLARLERDGRARSTRDGIWWMSKERE